MNDDDRYGWKDQRRKSRWPSTRDWVEFLLALAIIVAAWGGA